MVMAYGPQGDLAVLDLDRAPADLSSQGSAAYAPQQKVATPPQERTAQSDVDAYLYADRGVYRPGETVHVNALLRDARPARVKDRKGRHRRLPPVPSSSPATLDKTPVGSIAADVAHPQGRPARPVVGQPRTRRRRLARPGR